MSAVFAAIPVKMRRPKNARFAKLISRLFPGWNKRYAI
jgi:hypothetical protein